jgi:hypothetical protein
VSHETGTPARRIGGMIGAKCAMAAMPEKALKATAARAMATYAVTMENS